MIEQFWILVLCLVAGLGLGVLFFGGLWWTIQRLQTVRHPGLLMSSSLISRSVLTVIGLFLVFDGHTERLLAALAGMLIVRFVYRRRIGSQIPSGRSGKAGAV